MFKEKASYQYKKFNKLPSGRLYFFLKFKETASPCMCEALIVLGFFKFIYFIYFIFGCIGSSLLHVCLLQLQRAGATLHCGARASHCGGFSCGAQGPGAQASVVVARRLSSCGSSVLERRLSSCGARAQLLRCMWDLPGPGLEPVSPALAGGFLTTAPPGKPSTYSFEKYFHFSRLFILVGNYIPVRLSYLFVHSVNIY